MMQIGIFGTLIFELKMGVVLYGGILGSLIFGSKMRIGILKKTKN